MISIGIGIPFGRRGGIDSQAKAHFDRVIADGGLVPSGLSGVNAFFTTVKSIYGTADITTAISVGLDAQVLGYKLGAGSGTTLGQAAQKLYSCSGSSGDVVQTTAASQPLLLVHSGANYFQGVGVANNYVTTPSSAVSNITGDIEMVAKISIYDETGEKVIIAKRAGASASYVFSSTSKLLRFRINTTTYDSNASHSFAVNEEYFAKVTRQQSSGDIKFFTSLDGITYTQLGTTISGITVPIDTFSTPLTVGLLGDLNSFAMRGKIFRATISNAIGGAPVIDFNPNQYNAANSQTQWTSSTGEVWSLNVGTATTGYKGQLVTKTIVQSDGIDDRMQAATLNINTPAVSLYSAFRKFNNTAGATITELGPNYSTTNGFGLYVNSLGAAAEAFGIFGNVFNARVYNSNSLLLKLSTAIGDTSIPDPETQYFINNSAQSVFATFSAANNTTGINQTELNVFGRSGGTSFANLNMNTFIVSITNNNSTLRTSMYDYIRSINNNAF
jgi:hypothetical protein